MNIWGKIPIVRSFIRDYKKVKFQKKWRRKNPHNETVAGNIFPIDIVSVGKGGYGLLNIQSLSSTSGERLTIGNYVSIAPGVLFILGGNHQVNTITSFPIYPKAVKPNPILDAQSKGPITIEDEVWIGTNVIILSGVTIGKGAIIAAGAVVIKDVPPYALVGGNPAHIIKYRYSPEIIDIISSFYLTDLSKEQIVKNIDVLYKKIESVEDAKSIMATLEECK